MPGGNLQWTRLQGRQVEIENPWNSFTPTLCPMCNIPYFLSVMPYLVQTFKSMLLTGSYFCGVLTLPLSLFLQRRFSSLVFNFLHPLPFFPPFLSLCWLFFLFGLSLAASASFCWGPNSFPSFSFVSLTIVFTSNLQTSPRDEGRL